MERRNFRKNSSSENNSEEEGKKKSFGPKWITHLPGPSCKGMWKLHVAMSKNPKKYGITPKKSKFPKIEDGLPKWNKKKREVTLKLKNGEVVTTHYDTIADLMIPAKGRRHVKNVRMPPPKTNGKKR